MHETTSTSLPKHSQFTHIEAATQEGGKKLFTSPKIQSRALFRTTSMRRVILFRKFCQQNFAWNREDACRDHMQSKARKKREKHHVAHTLNISVRVKKQNSNTI